MLRSKTRSIAAALLVAGCFAPAVTRAAQAAPSEACPQTGHISYTLSKAANPTADQSDAYGRITTAMDSALSYYNCYTSITKSLQVSYVPSVPTADGSQSGSIRFGSKSTMLTATAMHEIGHTVGVGVSSEWSAHMVNGVWNGTNATQQIRTISNDPDATVHGDANHFWPYGLNQESEVKSTADLIAHCQIVVALRKDMGMA